jgi:hypothetical protein
MMAHGASALLQRPQRHHGQEGFPIPLVDETLDELHNAWFFTKLALYSSHYQVCINQDDMS